MCDGRKKLSVRVAGTSAGSDVGACEHAGERAGRLGGAACARHVARRVHARADCAVPRCRTPAGGAFHQGSARPPCTAPAVHDRLRATPGLLALADRCSTQAEPSRPGNGSASAAATKGGLSGSFDFYAKQEPPRPDFALLSSSLSNRCVCALCGARVRARTEQRCVCSGRAPSASSDRPISRAEELIARGRDL